jgi:hypothetical protein
MRGTDTNRLTEPASLSEWALAFLFCAAVASFSLAVIAVCAVVAVAR